MQLLPDELRRQIPPLYSQERVKNDEKMVYAKFFFPAGNWTWFVLEGEAEDDDYICFGYTIGQEEEFGYFSLNELQSIKIHGLTVERDLYFQPGKFSDMLKQFHRERGQ